LLEFDEHHPEFGRMANNGQGPKPSYCEAVGTGSKKSNRAQVYAGWYCYENHRVPTVLVVKCGAVSEQDGPKPGNRGKRDSQLILMNFFSRCLFYDRMSELDFDLFRKIRWLTGVNADRFEACLMVDADTKVHRDVSPYQNIAVIE
jgi:chitin synthase